MPRLFEEKIAVKGDIKGGFRLNRLWDSNRFTAVPGPYKLYSSPFVPDDSTIIGLLKEATGAKVTKRTDTTRLPNYVYTQPLDTMLSIMMHRSDNFFAEQALLMVSEEVLGEMSDRQIIRRLLETDFVRLPQSPVWVDGSGLSRYNLLSPKDFVYLLDLMQKNFGLDRMKVILPTGGKGTLSSLYRQDSSYIFAKTGTLNGVVSLSGYLITRKNRLLIFSVLVNNHHGPAADIRKGIERLLKEVRKRY